MTVENNQNLYLQALQNPYISIYDVDVTDYTYDALYLAPFLNYVPKKGFVEELLKMFINHSIYSQYHGAIQEFLSQDTLSNRFHKDKVNESTNTASIDYQIRRKGEPRWIRLIVSVVSFHEDGNIHHVLVMLQDITEDKNDAAYDQLTTVYNRDHGVKLINHILSSHHGKGRFIIIDIDFFKQVNDRLGHQKGDEVLINCSKYLKQSFNEHAILLRLGGDEFVVFEQIEDDKMVENLENICHGMKITYEKNNRHVQVSGSFGVVDFTSKYHSFDELYAKADKALYLSKQKGRNIVTYYNEEVELQDKYDRVVLRLEKAIRNQHIEVYYQPIVRSINGNLSDVEALVRWHDPELGIIPPDRFINALEEQRMIHILDLHVIRTVCKDIRDIMDHKNIAVPVSVNLSRNDFIACDIFEEIEKIVKEYDIPRALLNIEITESVFMENASLIYRDMLRFQKVGYQVWMDDFGSGFSSLNMLKEYPFDLIKLDIEFLRNFDERSKTMITSIVTMAKRLGVRVLIEGVETKEQFEFVKSIGIERAQGYYFNQPLPLQKLNQWISDNNIKAESTGWKVFYDKLGYIDFTTDKTLALLEFDGAYCNYLFVNSHYLDVCRSTNIQNIETIFDKENAGISPINQLLIKYYDALEERKNFRDFEYYILGQVIRIHADILFKYHGKSLVQVEITNLTQSKPKPEDEREIESIFRMMFSSFDATIVENLKTNTVKSLYTEINRNPELDQVDGMTIQEFEEFTRDHLIHYDDRKFYDEWISEENKQKNIYETTKKFDVKFFRTKVPNGDYVWKTHQITYAPIEDLVTYTTRQVPVLDDPILNQVFFERLNQSYDERRATFVNNIMNSQSIHMFWKDKDRKFVGANRSFLDTYGFKDESEIIGKTDEDMGWHIDDEPFRNEELAILKEGRISINKPGKCIIKGVSYNILATKEPIYQNGEIIGLFGYFNIVNDLTLFNTTTNIEVFDQEMHMLTAKGMLNIILDYLDSLKRQNEQFAVIHITCPHYEYLNDLYGSEVSNQLLKIYAEKINEIIGKRGNCARLYASHFMIVSKYEKQEDINHITAKLNTEISSIHSINGFPVTLQPTIVTKFSETTKDLKDLIDIPFAMDEVIESTNS